jgi:hypothetical protein
METLSGFFCQGGFLSYPWFYQRRRSPGRRSPDEGDGFCDIATQFESLGCAVCSPRDTLRLPAIPRDALRHPARF